MAKKWYIVHVYSGFENKVKASLDEKIASSPNPDKFDKAVHMSSIHLDKGMHCVDCHFAQDNHGTGNIHGEVAAAVAAHP